MPIRVICPACNKKLTAKEKLAGKQVKCPACGEVLSIPEPAAITPLDPQQQQISFQGLCEAIESDDIARIVAYFHQRDVLLIKTSEESEDGELGILVAELDEGQATVAFTSIEFVRAFGEMMPDMLDEDGSLPVLEVSGRDFLANHTAGFGVLLNPETEESLFFPPDLLDEMVKVRAGVQLPTEGAASDGDPRAQAVRESSLAELRARGFQPADWLPLPDLDRSVRPARDIASRLLSLATLFTYVSAPESAISTERVRQTIKKNSLRAWLTDEEVKILSLPRREAHQQHANAIGWKLENMWPLAWALGFDHEPTIEASQIGEEVSSGILFDLLSGLDTTVEELIRNATLRSAEEVNALEDRFYCAHNAVRSAQLGGETVPDEFDPVAHGGAVHERRHALTWCLSAGTDWDETDLST